MDYVPAIMRWLHLMAGVMWIGLLYYFNFVQVTALKAAAADNTAAGITKHVAPRALLYFRWAAVVTWVMGALNRWGVMARVVLQLQKSRFVHDGSSVSGKAYSTNGSASPPAAR